MLSQLTLTCPASDSYPAWKRGSDHPLFQGRPVILGRRLCHASRRAERGGCFRKGSGHDASVAHEQVGCPICATLPAASAMVVAGDIFKHLISRAPAMPKHKMRGIGETSELPHGVTVPPCPRIRARTLFCAPSSLISLLHHQASGTTNISYPF